MSHTLAAASSFSSGRAYPSLSFFSNSPLSSFDPYSEYVGVNISLNHSSSLSFLNVYAPPIRSSPTDSTTNSFSPSILLSSRYLFILEDFNCYHLLWDSKGTFKFYGDKIFDWVISSDFLPLNESDIPTLFHCSSGICSSPDISFALFSLALSCSWVVLQDLGSDHSPVLLTVPLSLWSFAPTNVSLPSIFKELVGMTSLFTMTLTVLQRNNCLILFPMLLFFSLF